MSEQQNAASRTKAKTEAALPTERPDSTAGWCLCARDSDRWMCQDRPRFDEDAEGRCCSLGGILEMAGTDNWNRPDARQALRDTPCEVDRADA